jgi:hypothetical protein
LIALSSFLVGFGKMPVHTYEECDLEQYAQISPVEYMLWCGDYALVVVPAGDSYEAVWEFTTYEANTFFDCAYKGDCAAMRALQEAE